MPLQSLAGAERRGLTALGVSAFAFQGSNAHVIVTSTAQGLDMAALNRSSRSAAGWSSPSVPWSTSRVWVHPVPCTLLTSVVKSAAGRGVVYELELSAAHMAHVWDHRVSGAALVPGVLFMEMAACALQQALLVSGSSNSKAAPALADVTIPAALVLPELEAGQSDRQAARLRCIVQHDTVQVSSSSRSAGGMQHTVHLQAQPAAIATHSSGDTAPHIGQQLWAALASLLPGIYSAARSAASAPAGTAAATALLSACEHQGHTAASGCAEPSQLDALLQLAAVLRGHLQPELAEQLQVPAAAELYIPAAASADSHSSSAKLASAAVRPGLTASAMVADFQMVAADGAGSVCSIVGLQAKKATAAALVRRPVPLPQVSLVGPAVAETEVSKGAEGKRSCLLVLYPSLLARIYYTHACPFSYVCGMLQQLTGAFKCMSLCHAAGVGPSCRAGDVPHSGDSRHPSTHPSSRSNAIKQRGLYAALQGWGPGSSYSSTVSIAGCCRCSTCSACPAKQQRQQHQHGGISWASWSAQELGC